MESHRSTNYRKVARSLSNILYSTSSSSSITKLMGKTMQNQGNCQLKLTVVLIMTITNLIVTHLSSKSFKFLRPLKQYPCNQVYIEQEMISARYSHVTLIKLFKSTTCYLLPLSEGLKFRAMPLLHTLQLVTNHLLLYTIMCVCVLYF